MIKKINAINKILLDLMTGVFLFSLLCELAGVWFVTRKVYYSLGILAGFLVAEFMVYQMASALEKAMYEEKKGAENKVRMAAVIRYTVVAVVLFVLCITDVANPLAAFLSIMGVKVAAYLQPVMHKGIERIKERKRR